jgi:nucleoside-diphosphate-sugar epimerase
MKKLLVTGARGFIGRQTLAPALEAGYEVHAVSTSTEVPESLSRLPVQWHTGNLLDAGMIERLVKALKPSHVLHMAWETSHGAYWTSPANLAWLELGTRLVRAFVENGGSRIVSAGTCAEYDWAHGLMSEGVTPEKPNTFYGRIKLAHHDMLIAAAQQFGFSAATGRIFFGYGPFEDERRVIPHACVNAIRGTEANFSSGQFYRDFMHVSDIGRGFIALLDSDIQGPCNVSSGIPAKLSDLILTVERVAKRRSLFHLGVLPDRPGDPLMVAGNSHLLKSTGWAPVMQIEVGIQEALAWWRGRIS